MQSELESLLRFYANHYKVDSTSRSDTEFSKASDIARQLFEKDYKVVVFDNSAQEELCNSYPLQIIVPVDYSKSYKTSLGLESEIDQSMKLCFQNSRFARVHGRFVVPAIFLRKGQFVCRSSTLAIEAESVLQNVQDKFWNVLSGRSDTNNGIFGYEKQRNTDFYVMTKLNVKFIFDLMVESHKKMYGIQLTSSEKAEPSKYAGMAINSIPYPGCEFFRPFKLEKNRSAVGLYYDWNLEFVNAQLQLNPVFENLEINWSEYKKWDLVLLTNNYLRHIFASISSSNASALVHCISGWDRTPLFISLIRICLWADGLAHESLSAEQFLYLTLSYDWLLFSHQLKNRLVKNEEIMYFCFYFLQFLDKNIEFNGKSFDSSQPLSSFKIEIYENYFSYSSKPTNVRKKCSLFLDHAEAFNIEQNYSAKELSDDSNLQNAENKEILDPGDESFVSIHANQRNYTLQDNVYILNSKLVRKLRLLKLWEIFRDLYEKVVDLHAIEDFVYPTVEELAAI